MDFQIIGTRIAPRDPATSAAVVGLEQPIERSSPIEEQPRTIHVKFKNNITGENHFFWWI